MLKNAILVVLIGVLSLALLLAASPSKAENDVGSTVNEVLIDEDLYQVFDVVSPDIMSLGGVKGIGIGFCDTDEVKIVVYLEDQKSYEAFGFDTLEELFPESSYPDLFLTSEMFCKKVMGEVIIHPGITVISPEPISDL